MILTAEDCKVRAAPDELFRDYDLRHQSSRANFSAIITIITRHAVIILDLRDLARAIADRGVTRLRTE